MAVLVEAMETQLELARSAQKSAEDAQTFTKWMAWGSLGVAVASLAAAVTAIILSLNVPV